MSEKFNEGKVEIELKNFSYSDSPKFFGRKKELERFKELLGRKGGSCLISGYRGVGKTRFVEVSLNQYLEYKDGIKIQINLGGDNNLSSKAVLFNMASLLNEKLKNFKPSISLRKELFKKYLLKIKDLPTIRKFHSVLAILLLATSYSLLSLITPELLNDFIGPKYAGILNSYFHEYENDTNTFAVIHALAVLFFIISLALSRIFYSSNLISKSQKELENLLREMSSTSENNLQLGVKSTIFQKKNTSGPLDNNQIESRLKKILDDLESINLEIIFVFDELDKLSGNASERKDFDIDIIKESKLRKQQIDSILGDLKNLITSSKAKYIFIAGRDMYDAYLSERGSSNSLYESLFNGYIYLPSLLTDRSDEKVYLLDSMIESFVVSNLIKTCSLHEDSITGLGLIDYAQYKNTPPQSCGKKFSFLKH
jgi:hypothetical protein